jgi:hypothetical protein
MQEENLSRVEFFSNASSFESEISQFKLKEGEEDIYR